MISNDLPSLKNVFQEFRCGEVVDYPLTSIRIKNGLNNIFQNYEDYKHGAESFYNSVDCLEIIAGIFR
jgi:hypothetical protein